MKNSNIITVVMTIFIMASLFTGCDNGGRTDLKRPKIAVSDLKMELPKSPISPACELPKPEDLGCTTICKPCVTWVCKEGKWERLDIQNPDICGSNGGPGSPPPSACPRTDTGFCPAECKFCF